MSRTMICVPVTAEHYHEFVSAIGEAEALADIIELRLDYLCAGDLPRLIAALTNMTGPFILTFRPGEQGGKRELSLSDRQAFWRGLPQQVVEKIAFADLELDLVESFHPHLPWAVPWEKVICSWHDFRQSPADLFEIYDRIARTPAAVVKIATQANDISDCLRIFEVIERAKSSKPIIALAMGMPGVMTRVLALSRGAMLTFGALRRGAESAGGQPTVDELENLYRTKQLSRDSQVFGLVGKPVGHSRSPLIHNSALKEVNIDGVYLPFEVEDVEGFVHDFVRPKTKKIDWNLRGLSVTIPHKLAIMPCLDLIDATARKIGAVNTVVVEGDELRGHNTDVFGAMKPLDELIDVKDTRVAVIGAGGSARAVCYGLNRRGADVTIYARNLSRAQLLADEFNARLSGLEDFAGKTDIVINCTPIGMHGHSEGQSPIKIDALRGIKLVYDLIYTPVETALLKDAKNAGCRTLGGMAMLAAQAGEQFRLWTGLEAKAYNPIIVNASRRR